MARRVTEKDIQDINEAYLICHTISGTAKATGWSTSTVSKYLIKDYQSKGISAPLDGQDIIIEPAALDEAIDYLLSHSNLSSLTEQERKDMKAIWKGMLV